MLSLVLRTHHTPVLTRAPVNARLFVKKVVITTVANVPGLKPVKDDLLAAVRGLLRIPHQKGFRCISLLAPNEMSLFLDVGANSGQCINSIRLFAPKSPIVSFEPNPIMADCIRRKFRNDTKLRVECVAAGSQPGEFYLFVPFYRGQSFPELASFEGDAVAQWLPDRIWGFRPGWHRVEKIQCMVCRLDDLKLAPFLIKIDICCLQAAVIRGALGTIEAHKPFLILTGAQFAGECYDLLAPYGYHMFVYDKGRFRKVRGYSGSACLIPDEKRAQMPASLFAATA
jgi:FkbM family methyltransferase